jgi:hypothetical protein
MSKAVTAKKSMLDDETLAKAMKFLGQEAIFCVLKGVMKRPMVDKNGNGEKYYTFNLRTTRSDGYNQTFHCIMPAKVSAELSEEEIQALKDCEILVIPQLQNSIQEWKNKETNKVMTNNRLTVYVTRFAYVGPGDSEREYDDGLKVNW